MAGTPDSPLDQLWKEYSAVFRELDDLSLARWLAQTLGQLEGKAWRLSHPLLGAYRLAAQIGQDKHIWFKRLAYPPTRYTESPCCRAPILPMLTRDVRDAGLICQHCNDTLVPFDEIPDAVRDELGKWADAYQPVHAVAHWEDKQRKASKDYEQAVEDAAKKAEKLLQQAGGDLAVRLLEFYPAIIWEDQDECLEVRPEDIQPAS
jgi:hypothetical protein